MERDAVTIDSFFLEDVRCFAGRQEVRVRPLTFLVGENGTGKSTVLGCMQAVADYMAGVEPEIDFNRHLYEMGSFREIVRRSRPHLESFKLGWACRDHDGQEAACYTVELHEQEDSGWAVVKQVTSASKGLAAAHCLDDMPESWCLGFLRAASIEPIAGSEAPAELAKLARKGGAQWDRLKAQLEEFGREAGLFSELSVRRLRRSDSDPIVLQVKARGATTNIKDAGDGVSQALSILVRLAHPNRAAAALIQQPEVRLHPRGQAALSSFLVGLLDSEDGHHRPFPSHFVIETHSDYMIDRARIAIRRKQISADDVSLVYLEPKPRGGVTVHNLRFDELGNLIGAPSGYRDFFLKETDALLGFGEE